MKGAAYVGFVFSALAAAGIQGLHRWTAERWNNNIIQRVGAHTALIVIATGLCALMGVNQAQVVIAHLDQPGLYPDDAPTLLALRQIIPPGSTVTLTSDQRVRGVISGFAAYALDHTVVWGHVRTGYARSQTGDIDAIGEYGLLYALLSCNWKGPMMNFLPGAGRALPRAPGTPGFVPANQRAA
jgi:hypothetical protein